MAHRAAVGALENMPAQCNGAAGNDGAPRLGLGTGERMRGKIVLPVRAEDVGQLDAAAAGHALRCNEFGGRQQIEWGPGLGELFLEVEIAGGGGNVAVTHQSGNGVDIDTGFE